MQTVLLPSLIINKWSITLIISGPGPTLKLHWTIECNLSGLESQTIFVHHSFFFTQPKVILWDQLYCRTRSLGALRAPTSSWGPFGPLDFVLRALRALRPCDPRSFSQEGRHEGELPKNTGLLSLPSHDDYHECWVNKYRSFVDPAFVIIIMGREREQNRIFCDTDRGGGGAGIGHSSKLMCTKLPYVFSR